MSSLSAAVSTLLNLDEVGGVEGFVQAVRDNLASGTFVYAVVARTLPATLNTVLKYLAEISRIQTAAILVDHFQDGGRRIIVPRVSFASASAHKPPPVGTAKKTNPTEFLAAVGSAAPFWSEFLEFLEGLPGKFFWGEKGFSYRAVDGNKQYSVAWGYPRTIWWLKDKNLGDQLSVLIDPDPKFPSALRARVLQAVLALGTATGGIVQKEKTQTTKTFYVAERLPPEVDTAVRTSLRAVFAADTPAANP